MPKPAIEQGYVTWSFGTDTEGGESKNYAEVVVKRDKGEGRRGRIARLRIPMHLIGDVLRGISEVPCELERWVQDGDPATPPKDDAADRTCPACNREFTTVQGLGLHFAHGCAAKVLKEAGHA